MQSRLNVNARIFLSAVFAVVMCLVPWHTDAFRQALGSGKSVERSSAANGDFLQLQLIVGQDVTQATNDKKQMMPMVGDDRRAEWAKAGRDLGRQRILFGKEPGGSGVGGSTRAEPLEVVLGGILAGAKTLRLLHAPVPSAYEMEGHAWGSSQSSRLGPQVQFARVLPIETPARECRISGSPVETGALRP